MAPIVALQSLRKRKTHRSLDTQSTAGKKHSHKPARLALHVVVLGWKLPCRLRLAFSFFLLHPHTTLHREKRQQLEKPTDEFSDHEP